LLASRNLLSKAFLLVSTIFYRSCKRGQDQFFKYRFRLSLADGNWFSNGCSNYNNASVFGTRELPRCDKWSIKRDERKVV